LRKIDKSRTFTQGSEYELPQNLFAYRRIKADQSVLGSWARVILEIKFLSPAKITAEIRPGYEGDEKN
jgi:hypothetical protein